MNSPSNVSGDILQHSSMKKPEKGKCFAFQAFISFCGAIPYFDDLTVAVSLTYVLPQFFLVWTQIYKTD